MVPILKENERLWLNRWGRTTKQMPKRGDIITFEAPSVIRVDEINYENPVAIYNYEPKGVLQKFAYYVIETPLKKSYIKRVIGLPGEYIEIKDGNVYIDGIKLKEDYLPKGTITDMVQGSKDGKFFTNFTVPDNYVFALGDNRSASTDCRTFGCIPLEKIESTLSFRFWPLNLFGKVK